MSDVVRVLIPAGLAFAIGIACTPLLTYYLYKYKAWKKSAFKVAYDGKVAEVFDSIHRGTQTRAPRFGGIVVWGSALLTVGFLSFASFFSPSSLAAELDFLSRSQTWIPFAALLAGAFVGFIDDLLIIRPRNDNSEGNGLRLRWRLLAVTILSGAIGWWFFEKLDVTAIRIPFDGPLEIGWLIIPFFVIVSLAIYASGVIDGIDGLSGGVFASVFASYAVIAFVQNQTDLAAFCAVICGGLLAFIWYNIPPARFYLSDTGTMALTLTIPVVAFMTDDLGGGIGVAAFPLIGALLAVTVASDILQLTSKKLFGRKIFRIAPLHHHFEALGWPPEKVVMRYWVLSIVFAFLGVILALAGR